jgi:integrase
LAETIERKNILMPDEYSIYHDLSKILSTKPLKDLDHSDCHKAVMQYVQSKEPRDANEKKRYYDKCMRILKIGFQYFVNKGKIKKNPLKEFSVHIDQEAVIRRHLTKKSLTLSEEQLIFNELCVDNYINPMSFGMTLMLLTGMTLHEVCALKFGDVMPFSVLMSKLPEGEFEIPQDENDYVIIISRVYRRIADVFQITEMVESKSTFRIIPISRMCKKIIELRCNYLVSQNIGVKKLADMPMVCKGDNSPAGILEYCNPDTLSKFVKKFMLKSNIQQQDLYLPIQKYVSGKTKQGITNLELALNNRLLRTNFEYRAKYVCKLTDSEINYLLGRMCQDVTSKHYREFREIFNQHVLLQKLDRWIINGFQEKKNTQDDIQPTDGRNVLADDNINLRIHPQGKNDVAAVVLDLICEPGKMLNLDLSCLKGMSGSIVINDGNGDVNR